MVADKGVRSGRGLMDCGGWRPTRMAVSALLAALLAACGPGSGSGDTPAPLPDPPPAGEATPATEAANAAVAERLPLEAPADFDDATRGLLAQIQADAITDADGNTVWPIADWSFLEGDAPATVNPSLWRQSRLNAIHGLFELKDGLYQVRGYDLAVMTVIRGDEGWIVIDPLLSAETAAAALDLVNETLGPRPVTGILYTHSHVDHFGGVRGIITEDEIAARGVPILAPEGFSESAVAENLLAGNHMSRRAALMFGNNLPLGPLGHVGAGLGQATATGRVGLILPTEEIGETGARRTIDGVTFEFMDAAGTEAPAEFMFYLPQFDALCTAEVATANFHNVLTLRGAKVRDALLWSRTIDDALVTYGDRIDLVFASHHWPTWGQAEAKALLASQRDIYRYVHDQTLRRANAGATRDEAAEAIPEPAVQAREFATRGYYGTLTHNAKAVYQYYFGWWSGVPAEFHALPRAEAAPRYVQVMGGPANVIQAGAEAYGAGEYRWAAELLNHAVWADPSNATARGWLAAAYEQLGFQAESGTWRSYYLSAAARLRNPDGERAAAQLGNADFLRAVPTDDLFDALAVRFAPEQLTRDPFTLAFRFPDTGETLSVEVGPDVIVPRLGLTPDAPAATLTMDRRDLDRLVLREAAFPALVASGAARIEGDATALGAFFNTLDAPPGDFNVVVP